MITQTDIISLKPISDLLKEDLDINVFSAENVEL